MSAIHQLYWLGDSIGRREKLETTASTLALTLVFPLQRIKVALQTHRLNLTSNVPKLGLLGVYKDIVK